MALVRLADGEQRIVAVTSVGSEPVDQRKRCPGPAPGLADRISIVSYGSTGDGCERPACPPLDLMQLNLVGARRRLGRGRPGRLPVEDLLIPPPAGPLSHPQAGARVPSARRRTRAADG